jgi:glycosyltransferase involved in cell wall biosynthesis
MGTTRSRIVFWNNQPAPYVVDWFNAIAKLDAFDFEAWFDVEKEPDRRWDVDPSRWHFMYRYMGSDPILSRRLTVAPIELLRAVRPDVFVQNLDYPRHLLGACVARTYVHRLGIAAEPSPDRISQPRRTRELAKHLVLRGVDGAAVSGPDGTSWVTRYGLTRDRTWWTREGVDTEHFGRFRYMSASQRARLRGELGLKENVFLYVGRLEREKGLLTLLHAFQQFTEERNDVSLLIVGSGTEEDAIRRTADVDPGMVFLGHKTRCELPRLYAMADALLFPTFGDSHGMVVEEAMAAGVPVISSAAAGNIAYRVVPDSNGFLVRPGSSEDLLEAMQRFVGLSFEQRRMMSRAAVAHAESVTPEVYARDFVRFVEALLAAPQRRSLAGSLMRIAGTLTTAVWPFLGASQASHQAESRGWVGSPPLSESTNARDS